MTKIAIPMDIVELDLGDKTIEVSLLDIYYTMVNSATTLVDAPSRTKMEAMAKAINEEYSCNISWGQAAHLLSALDEKMNELKKNTTQEPESPDGTE